TLSTPRDLWSEQDAREWWTATTNSIRHALTAAGVSGADVEPSGLTVHIGGLVVLDQERQILGPAVLWNDQRCGAECDQIRARVGPERLIKITGNDALTGFTAPNILWIA